jgi:hypothetical protein
VNQEQPSRWRAGASPGGLLGLVLTILATMAVVTSILGITGRADLPLPDAVLWVVFAVAILAVALFAFLVWAYLSITYQFEAGTLRIRWGLWSDEIPLAEVDSISPLTEVAGADHGGWQPFWPGYYVGKRHTPAGTVQVVSTLQPRRQVLISVSDGRRFAISPERPLLFMEEFERRQNLPERREGAAHAVGSYEQSAQRFVEAGWTTEYSTAGVAVAPDDTAIDAPAADIPEITQRSPEPPPTKVFRSRPSSTSPMLRPIILTDPVALLLIAVGVFATGAMVVYILIQYQDIPPSLTLHWNVDGLPGRVGEPREIWILPTIAGLVLLANFGLAWSIALFDRFAARLMLGSTVAVHVVAWIALLMLLR